MSRIDRLIAKLCPDGVEFRELQEIFITKNGYTPSTTNKAYWTDGTVPWFRMEDIRENGRILNNSLQQITKEAVKGGRLFPANSIIIATSATIGEHAFITVPHLSNQRFTSLALKSEFVKRLDMKFVFYYCFVLDNWCRNNTTTSSFASVEMNGFKKFRFPLPPLEIQQEIVAILDKFTKLEAELEAELETRQRQYKHYRDALLTFSERTDRPAAGRIVRRYRCRSGGGENMSRIDRLIAAHCSHGIKYSPVNMVVDILSTPRGIKRQHYGDGSRIPIVDQGQSLIAGYTDNELASLCSAEYIVFGEHTRVVKWIDFKFAPGAEGTKILQAKKGISLKYIYYAITNLDIPSRGYNRHWTILRDIPIPVPPLEIQQEIVSILDKFDALVNDLSIGLPAEIRARRRQYEYYRDRLLTFREAA